MAKKKRAKVTKEQVQTRYSVLSRNISRDEMERGYTIAKKLLIHCNLDPSLLDGLSKRQRFILFACTFELPTVKPAQDRTVPRQFLRQIHADLFRFLKSEYCDFRNNQVSYMEYVTIGVSFFTALRTHFEKGLFTGTPQEEAIRKIYDELTRCESIMEICYEDINEHIHKLTSGFSQVNFRSYGFRTYWEQGASLLYRRLVVRITAQNCESKMFTHHGIERKAFRLVTRAYVTIDPENVTVDKKLIFPSAKEDEKLNVYIQSHALHRFKERMDIIEPTVRNRLLQYFLIDEQTIIKLNKQVVFQCSTSEDTLLGYFTFFVHDDDLIINSFIPAVGESMPEGRKLHRLLRLSKEETSYLGMEKISFFLKVDFEQIPVLKQALIDSGLWRLKQGVEFGDTMLEIQESEIAIEKNKTAFVKNFFDKHEEHLRNQ